MQMEWQTEEQSDLGLHCLSRRVCHLRIFTVLVPLNIGLGACYKPLLFTNREYGNIHTLYDFIATKRLRSQNSFLIDLIPANLPCTCQKPGDILS